MTALRNVNRKVTAQTEKARPDQVKNNAGGFTFTVTDKDRLERFLILGTDGGTYYVTERDITKDSVEFLSKMIATDEELVRQTVLSVSDEGRAYRNSPALFTLALLFADGKDKAATRAIFDKVVRTSTHLFEFAQYIENIGGWGRSKRNAVADWYESKDADKLAYQLVKYRSRAGWTHRDMLRLSHPTRLDNSAAEFALHGNVIEQAPAIMQGYAQMAKASSVEEVVSILSQFKNLPWETIPTQFLNNDEVWKTLFYNGQLRGQNAIRNVGRLNKIGAFNDMVFANDFSNVITNGENIKKSRLHPVNFLNAILANQETDYYSWRYNAGKSNLPARIQDALNDGFYESFKHVEPANKRTLLALDVSASMWGGQTAGFSGVPAQAAAAMAMTIARTEPYYAVMGFSTQFIDLGISSRMRLDSVFKKLDNLPFGGTDCSLPMRWAQDNNIEIDTFVVITDNETWAGLIHPFQALQQYRNRVNPNARLAVMAMTPTRFSIADPKDSGSMDFVGMDSNTPKILTDFSAGRI